MKTGKFKDRITITVKVSVGCDEPWPPPTEDKAKLVVLQALRSTLQVIGESYEGEILSKVQAQLGEPNEWRNVSELNGWHQRNKWPNPIAAMTSVLEPDIKRRAEEIAEIVVKDVDAKVHELQANLHIVKKQLISILSLTEGAPNEVLTNAVRYAAEDALRVIGDDK